MLKSNATARFLIIFIRWVCYGKSLRDNLTKSLGQDFSADILLKNYVISSGVPMTPWLRKSICPGLTRPMARTGQSVSTKREKSTHIRQGGPRKKRPRASTASCKKKSQRDKAILAPHCTIHSREYRPALTRNERVRKSEKEDESNQTSSALRKAFCWQIYVYASEGDEKSIR